MQPPAVRTMIRTTVASRGVEVEVAPDAGGGSKGDARTQQGQLQ